MGQEDGPLGAGDGLTAVTQMPAAVSLAAGFTTTAARAGLWPAPSQTDRRAAAETRAAPRYSEHSGPVALAPFDDPLAAGGDQQVRSAEPDVPGRPVVVRLDQPARLQ